MVRNHLLFITCINLILLILLAGCVSADKIVHYNVTNNIQELDASLVNVGDLNGTDVLGYACLNPACSSISAYTIPGLANHTDTSVMTVTFPTNINTTDGYALYFYKAGYVTWLQQNVKFSGTGEKDSSSLMKLSRFRNCSANLSSISATQNGGNVILRVNLSSPIANNIGVIPNALSPYFTVNTTLVVNVTTMTGAQVSAISQTYNLNYSERKNLILNLSLAPGNYYIYAYSLPNDPQCLSAGSSRFYSPALPSPGIELDALSPAINIVYPSNGSSYGSDISSLNYTITERNPGYCWYSKNGGLANSTAVPCGQNFTGLSSVDGANTWTVYANDSYGNLNSNTTTFYVDKDTPRIWFESNSQASGLMGRINSLFVNITANDSSRLNITFNFYNPVGLAESTTVFANNYFENHTALVADGIYYFNATACDSMNHCNSTETRNYTLDISVPGISFISPLSRFYNTTTIPINISATNYSSVWFFNGTNNVSYPGFHYLTFSDETYTLYAYANDSVGNFNWTSVSFSVDTTYPKVNITSPSNGYNSANASVPVVYAIIEQNPNNCWWTWSNESFAVPHNLANCSNGTLLRAWAEGNNTIIIYANDSAGNIGKANVTFFVDSAIPFITSYLMQVQGQSWTANNVIYISPNNSAGIMDGARFNITASEVVDWVFRIGGTGSNWIETNNINFLRPSSCPYWNGTANQCSGAYLSEGNHSITVTLTDSSGNNVTDNSKIIVVDNTSPLLSYSGVLPNGTYNRSVTIVANASDNVGVAYTNLTLNGVAYVSGTPITSSSHYTFEIYAQDLAGNSNYTQLNFTVDVDAPEYYNISIYPPMNVSQNINYTPGANYTFNITWIDPITSIDTAVLYWSGGDSKNGTNYTTMYLPTQVTGNVYSFVLSDLAAGDYLYYFWANDSAGNINQTANNTVYRIEPIFYLYPFSLIPNGTINYGTAVNASCGGALLRTDPLGDVESGGINYSDVTDEVGLNIILAVGNYTYVCIPNVTIDENHSYTESMINLTVLAAIENGTLLLNGNASNFNAVYPATVNASFTNTTGAGTLYLNGTDITPSNNQNLDLAAGLYNFTLVIPANQNHTGLTITRFANISKANQTINLNVAPNTTVTYPTAINVTCDGELFRGSTNVTNEIGIDITLAAGTYNYSCRKYESQNFSSAEASQIVTVLPTSQNATLVISPGNNITYPAPVNATCNGMLMRSMNGGAYNDISAENGLNIILAGGSYSYWCYLNATQNSSYSEMLANVTVNPLVDTGSLVLNGNASDTSIVYPATVNASFTNDTSAGILYRNAAVITSLNNVDEMLAAGLYNFTLVMPANQNHTGLLITRFANISKASQTINFNVAPNTTVTYPTAINVTCDGELFRNNANVTNETGTNVLLGAGSYNYSCRKYGNENLSSNESNFTITVNQATGSVSLYINGSENSVTILDPQTLALNATLNNGVGTISLYLNGTLLNSSNTLTSIVSNYLFNRTGMYNATATYSGNQNYTSSFESFWINATDNAAPGITANLPTINITNNQNVTFTANFSDNFGLSNATLYLYNNQSGLIYNQTTINLGGATQSAVGIVIYLVEGVYTWFWQVLDLAGNQATSDNSTLTVDISGPSVAFASPANATYNTTIRTANPMINVTNSSDAASVWFFNGTGNMSYPGIMNIEFGEGSHTLIAYANDSLGNLNMSRLTFNVYLIRTILNSWIYGTFYPNNQTIDVASTTITSSTIENSWLNGNPQNVTNSTIRNSNVTDVFGELLNCTIIDSNFTGGSCQNSIVDPSNIGYSNISANSNVTNSYVWYSTVSNSNVTDSTIRNDTLTDSIIIRCKINTSTVDSSTMIDCTLVNVVANNSYVSNSTLENTNISDANITNGIIYNGTIVTANGSTYNATEDGPKNLTDLINYAPNAVIVSPSNGGSYDVNTPVSFVDGSTDANLQSADFNESLSYFWNFGDNSSSTSQNDSHTYASIGTYTINLTVKDRYNATSIRTISITIATPGNNGGSNGGGSSGGGSCVPNWTCGNWSICYPNGVQTRICTRSNPSCTANTAFDHSTVKNCTFVQAVLATSNASITPGNATNITSNATFFKIAGQKVRYWASITGAAIGANKVPIFWAIVFIVAIIIAIIVTRYVVLKKSKARRR